MGVQTPFSLNGHGHQPRKEGAHFIDPDSRRMIQLHLMRTHFNTTYGKFFDKYSKNLMLEVALHNTQTFFPEWKLQNRVFTAVMAMMLTWLVLYWLASKLHWSLPMVSATFIIIVCKYPAIHILVMAFWLLGKMIYRLFAGKPKDIGLEIASPHYLTRPIEVKERIPFKEIQSTVELFILLAVGIGLVYIQNTSLYPLLAAIVFIAFLRAVPTAGGHSTMGVISLVLLMVFTLGLLGPVMVTQWKLVLGISEVPPPTSPTPVIMTDVPSQIWVIWETLTTQIFSGIGLGLNLLTFTGFARSALGYVFLFYSTLDALFGPGALLAGMIFMTRTRDTAMQRLTVANLTSSHLMVTLVLVIWTCGTGGIMQVLSCLIGFILASLIWYLCGAQPWLCHGIFARMIEARTDVQITRFDNPSGYRVALARFVGLILLVLYMLEGGFTGMATILLLLAIPVMKSEKLTCLYVGLLSSSLFMCTLALWQPSPLSDGITSGTVTAADPTFVASGRNSDGVNIPSPTS